MDFLGPIKSNSCHEYPVDIMEELKAIEEMEQAGKRARALDHIAEETKESLQEEARKREEAEKLAREKAVQDEVRRLLEEEERLAKERKISEMKKRQQEERIRVEQMVAQRKLEQEMEHQKKMEYEELKRKELEQIKEQIKREKFNKFQDLKDQEVTKKPEAPPRVKKSQKNLAAMRFEQRTQAIQMEDQMLKTKLERTRQKQHPVVKRVEQKSSKNLCKTLSRDMKSKSKSKLVKFLPQHKIKESTNRTPSQGQSVSYSSLGPKRGSEGSLKNLRRLKSIHSLTRRPKEPKSVKEMQNYLISNVLFDINEKVDATCNHVTKFANKKDMEKSHSKVDSDIQLRQDHFESYKQGMEQYLSLFDNEDSNGDSKPTKPQLPAVALNMNLILNKFKGETTEKSSPDVKPSHVGKLNINEQEIFSRVDKKPEKEYVPVIIDPDAFARTMNKFEQYKEEEEQRELLKQKQLKKKQQQRQEEKSNKHTQETSGNNQEKEEDCRKDELKQKIAQELAKLRQQEADYNEKLAKENRKRQLMNQVRDEVNKIAKMNSSKNKDDCPRWIQMIQEYQLKLKSNENKHNNNSEDDATEPNDTTDENVVDTAAKESKYNDLSFMETAQILLSLCEDSSERWANDNNKIRNKKPNTLVSIHSLKEKLVKKDEQRETTKVKAAPHSDLVESAMSRLLQQDKSNQEQSKSSPPNTGNLNLDKIIRKFNTNKVQDNGPRLNKQRRKIIHLNPSIQSKDIKYTQVSVDQPINEVSAVSYSRPDNTKENDCISKGRQSHSQAQDKNWIQDELKMREEESERFFQEVEQFLENSKMIESQDGIWKCLSLLSQSEEHPHHPKTQLKMRDPALVKKKLVELQSQNDPKQNSNKTRPVGKLSRDQVARLEVEDTKSKTNAVISPCKTSDSYTFESIKRKLQGSRTDPFRNGSLKNFNKKKIIPVPTNNPEPNMATPNLAKKDWKWKSAPPNEPPSSPQVSKDPRNANQPKSEGKVAVRKVSENLQLLENQSQELESALARKDEEFERFMSQLNEFASKDRDDTILLGVDKLLRLNEEYSKSNNITNIAPPVSDSNSDADDKNDSDISFRTYPMKPIGQQQNSCQQNTFAKFCNILRRPKPEPVQPLSSSGDKSKSCSDMKHFWEQQLTHSSKGDNSSSSKKIYKNPISNNRCSGKENKISSVKADLVKKYFENSNESPPKRMAPQPRPPEKLGQNRAAHIMKNAFNQATTTQDTKPNPPKRRCKSTALINNMQGIFDTSNHSPNFKKVGLYQPQKEQCSLLRDKLLNQINASDINMQIGEMAKVTSHPNKLQSDNRLFQKNPDFVKVSPQLPNIGKDHCRNLKAQIQNQMSGEQECRQQQGRPTQGGNIKKSASYSHLKNTLEPTKASQSKTRFPNVQAGSIKRAKCHIENSKKALEGEHFGTTTSKLDPKWVQGIFQQQVHSSGSQKLAPKKGSNDAFAHVKGYLLNQFEQKKEHHARPQQTHVNRLQNSKSCSRLAQQFDNPNGSTPQSLYHVPTVPKSGHIGKVAEALFNSPDPGYHSSNERDEEAFLQGRCSQMKNFFEKQSDEERIQKLRFNLQTSSSVSNMKSKFNQHAAFEHTFTPGKAPKRSKSSASLLNVISLLEQGAPDTFVSSERQQIQAELENLRMRRDDITFEQLEERASQQDPNRIRIQDELRAVREARQKLGIDPTSIFFNHDDDEEGFARPIRDADRERIQQLQKILFSNPSPANNESYQYLQDELGMIRSRPKVQFGSMDSINSSHLLEKYRIEQELAHLRERRKPRYDSVSARYDHNEQRLQLDQELKLLQNMPPKHHHFGSEGNLNSAYDKERLQLEIELHNLRSQPKKQYGSADQEGSLYQSERLKLEQELEQLRRTPKMKYGSADNLNRYQDHEKQKIMEELWHLSQRPKPAYGSADASHGSGGRDAIMEELWHLSQRPKPAYGSADASHGSGGRDAIMQELECLRGNSKPVYGSNDIRQLNLEKQRIQQELQQLRLKPKPAYGSNDYQSEGYDKERAILLMELEALESRVKTAQFNSMNSFQSQKLKLERQREIESMIHAREKFVQQDFDLNLRNEGQDLEKQRIQRELEALRESRRKTSLHRINHGDGRGLQRSASSNGVSGEAQSRHDLDHETMASLRGSNSKIKAMFEAAAPKYKFGSMDDLPKGRKDSHEKPKPVMRPSVKPKEGRKWVMDTINKYFEVIVEENEEEHSSRKEDSKDDNDANAEVFYPDTDSESEQEDELKTDAIFKSTSNIRGLLSQAMKRASYTAGADSEALVENLKQNLDDKLN